MTKLEEIRNLRKQAQAGEDIPLRHFDEVFAMEVVALCASRAYLGSLSAAKTLHEAVLPGWAPDVSLYESGDAKAIVARARGGDLKPEIYSAYSVTTPARAWLIAIMHALEGQEASQ